MASYDPPDGRAARKDGKSVSIFSDKTFEEQVREDAVLNAVYQNFECHRRPETEATIQRLIDKGLIVRQDFFNITKLAEKKRWVMNPKSEDCCHEAH